ncbi:MAG: hypothetical protein JNM62_12325 [Flavobacteriales bacterium]|nr:hypothetical protein [Flavobacteriales bacterium]
MRTLGLFLLIVPALSSRAQCPFVPTITPNAVMFYCPDDEAELSTGAYDAYQWYRSGVAIPGATAQTLTVDQSDAGWTFTVEATLDGCTDTSASVLVDAWMGLLPFLISGGDEPYQVDGTGSYFCQGDTSLLVIGGPYVLVNWTNNDVPIPNESDDTLRVTSSGAYSAIVALGVCQDVHMGVGVQVPISFTASEQAGIVQDGDLLCAQPEGLAYTWYLNGVELPDATAACIAPEAEGSYTVLVDQNGPCEIPSEPFLATGMGDRYDTHFTVYPIPAADEVSIQWSSGVPLQGSWCLLDASGRIVRQGKLTGSTTLRMEVATLAQGHYVFCATENHGNLHRLPLQVLR